MGNFGSPSGFVLYGGVNLTPLTATLDDEFDNDLDDTTPIGAANPRIQAPGSRSGKVSIKGYYDADVDQAADMLSGTATAVMVIGSEGTTHGAGVRIMSGEVQNKYSRVIARKMMHRANSDYVSSGADEFGKILQALGAIAGTTTGTALDNAASSANGAAVTVQLTDLDLDGGSALTVKVQSSPDNSTWTDLETFTVITTAPASERKTVAGSIARYTRAVMTFTGGSAPTATLMVAIARF